MNKNNRVVTLTFIAIFLSIGAYFLISSRIHDEYIPNYNLDDFYEVPNRKMGVNEYKASQVSDEDMIKTYFSTYTMMLFNDIDRAYSHLSERAKKFYPNNFAFKILASGLTNYFTELPALDRYEVKVDDKTKNQIIKVSDQNGNIYVFTVEAVMKYTVDFE